MLFRLRNPVRYSIFADHVQSVGASDTSRTGDKKCIAIKESDLLGKQTNG